MWVLIGGLSMDKGGGFGWGDGKMDLLLGLEAGDVIFYLAHMCHICVSG